MVILYGIKSCDSVRKARRWLDAHDVAYRFHDFREHGLDPKLLTQWVRACGWDAVLNRRGTTWRALPAARKVDINEQVAIALMLEHPAMIKRPVLAGRGLLKLGFNAAEYAAALNGSGRRSR